MLDIFSDFSIYLKLENTIIGVINKGFSVSMIDYGFNTIADTYLVLLLSAE